MLAGSRITGKSGHKGWTREHIVPRSKGGKNGNGNIVLAHLPCNMARGNADPSQELLERAHAIHERAESISIKAAQQVFMDPGLRRLHLDFDYAREFHRSR